LGNDDLRLTTVIRWAKRNKASIKYFILNLFDAYSSQIPPAEPEA
jgi:hypothetical protein